MSAYTGEALKKAEEFKGFLNDLSVDNPELKQEVLAYYGGVKQNTISQWGDPLGDRHFPAFQLLMQPEAITVPLCKKFVQRFGMKIVPDTLTIKPNGSIIDEILLLGKIEGKFTDEVEKMDKKQLHALCDQLEVVIARLRAEANNK